MAIYPNTLNMYFKDDIRTGIIFCALAAAHQSNGSDDVLRGILSFAKMQAIYYDLSIRDVLGSIKEGLEQDYDLLTPES